MIRQVNLDMDEYRGKSTDTKPLGIANGATFLEIDTGAKYMYDEENGEWCLMPSSGGGGGGGGDNTEVISARTGADGTRYGSLKGRLDAENEDLNDKISLLKSQLEAKANTDGYYSDMTVGNAEQLVATVGIEDKVPYIFRTSGGTADIGDREVDMLVGGTVAWNQLVQNGNFAEDSGWDSGGGDITIANNVATFSLTNASASTSILGNVLGTRLNHKYYISLDAKFNDKLPNQPVYIGSGGYHGVMKTVTTLNVWVNIAGIFIRETENGSDRAAFYPRPGDWENGDTVDFRNFVCVDLTQMFGSAIADYIYGLEQSTPGAGVAWFKKLFPEKYYDYDPGSLKSVEGVQSHDMVGFNQFDLSEFAKQYPQFCTMSGNELNINSNNGGELYSKGIDVDILGNVAGAYCTCEIKVGTATNVRIRLVYEDDRFQEIGGTSSKDFVKYNVKMYYNVRIVAVRLNWSNPGTFTIRNICINLSWDGERNGEYEPYLKRSYPLDSSLTLRGVPKLDDNNQLYYDGDTYASDGTVTRKYDQSTITVILIYTNPNNNNYDFAVFAVPNMWALHGDKINIFGEKIIGYNSTFTSVDANGVVVRYSTDNLLLSVSVPKDTTKAQAESLLNGTKFVYELETPTTETADPFQNPQVVNDFGTEEYVTTSIVPVGHVTQYQANLRAKLEMSPDSPDGDGDYIVRQSGGENEYVPLVIPEELPTKPTENGTYVLKVTVSGGTPTLAWVAE